MPFFILNNCILRYKQYVNFAVHGNTVDYSNIFTFWRNKTFASLITYVMPACILALIPSVMFEIWEGHYAIAIVDVVAFLTAYFISLNYKIDLADRKVAVAILLSVFSLTQMAMGSFSMGVIYFSSLTIFISLQFSTPIAVLSHLFKVFVFFIFTIVFFFDRNILTSYFNLSFPRWIIYSSNFLFLDLMIVIMLKQLLTGLEKTMFKKANLYEQLEKEIEFKVKQNQLLKQSRQQYLTLFSKSPVAVFVVQSATNKILQVNASAIKNYGYSEYEFMNMKLDDLKLNSDFKTEEKVLDVPFKSINVTKSGKEINVEIRCTEIFFDGEKANLVIVTDISESIKHIQAIEQQNNKLKEIAYMQSHIVRVPVANIIGLTNLLIDNFKADEDLQLIHHLKNSVKDLDDIIKNMANQTN
ncbi:MAG: PAS domain S-box protein [Pedobacter sp.]|nr:MAG: PAS domain S-box protein [Pedobacter sp.]